MKSRRWKNIKGNPRLRKSGKGSRKWEKENIYTLSMYDYDSMGKVFNFENQLNKQCEICLLWFFVAANFVRRIIKLGARENNTQGRKIRKKYI